MNNSYREYLSELEVQNKIKRVDEEVDKNFEVPRILDQNQSTPVLFKKIKGYPDTAIIGNLCPTRQALSQALKVDQTFLSDFLIHAFLNPKKPEKVTRKKCWIEKTPDLSKLPIPKYYKGDGGHYLTSSIIVSKFPESGKENLSIHRIMILNERQGVIRILPRHLHKILESSKGEVNVALLLGVHPILFLAAALSANYGVSEYEIANSLMNGGLELVEMENGLRVPKGTELVLLGKINTKERAEEGPFVDITGTYDIVREEPIISFEKMLRPEKDFIFHALLPASKEHMLFMGLPQEIKMMLNLREKGIEVNKVNMTEGGCSYFHSIISIKKKEEDDGKKVIEEVFKINHPIKLIIVVDEDIDPFDLRVVEWALATRFQAYRGLIVHHNEKGSSLDPSSFKTGFTSKIGFDATLSINNRRGEFRRAKTW
ncbi:MAG: UbiD family decarboxylase [Nitrososphaeria archaeon]